MIRVTFLLMMVAGCLDTIGPDVGDPVTQGSDGASACPDDSDPSTVVKFDTDIRGGVFRRGNCNDCHTSNGLGVRQSGLDLGSYTTLRTGGGRSGANIVIVGDPCASILVQKIEDGPPFGRRMPYDGPPYLSTADIQLVRDWISEGAQDN